jgi:hypothetical protein
VLAAARKPEVCPAGVGDPKTDLKFVGRATATPISPGVTNVRSILETAGDFSSAEPEVLPSIESP